MCQPEDAACREGCASSAPYERYACSTVNPQFLKGHWVQFDETFGQFPGFGALTFFGNDDGYRGVAFFDGSQQGKTCAIVTDRLDDDGTLPNTENPVLSCNEISGLILNVFQDVTTGQTQIYQYTERSVIAKLHTIVSVGTNEFVTSTQVFERSSLEANDYQPKGEPTTSRWTRITPACDLIADPTCNGRVSPWENYCQAHPENCFSAYLP